LFTKTTEDIKNDRLPTPFVETFKSGVIKIEHVSTIVRSDELSPPYQKKGDEPIPPSYNLTLKQRARSQNKHRNTKVREYCKKAMPENYYVRVANKQHKVERFLYFDFDYAFLYCLTKKVIHFLM
jgi:hypothetical protein